MAERRPDEWAGPLSHAMRRAMETNLRFYEAVGRVTVDYLRALSGVWDETRRTMPGWQFTTAPAASAAPPGPTATGGATSAAAVVLEGPLGAEVRGAFVVTNDLPRRAVAPVMVSAFRDAVGDETAIPLRIEPGLLQLDPGARAVVQVVATVSDALREDAVYHAELSVPDLSASRIAVLLRRVARAAAPSGAEG
jgi:hypothetical protein